MRNLQAPCDSGRRPLWPSRLLPLLVLAVLLLGATDAFALSRSTAMARAQKWIDNPVNYSQSKYRDGYRTDCSGYASLVWQLGQSYTTRSLQHVTHRIKVSSLKPGDGMLCWDNHVRIFRGWVDSTHTNYYAYEQTGPTTKSSIKNMSRDLAPQGNGHRYYPVRLDKISDDSVPWNLAANPTFDVWAQSGDVPHATYSPAWWGAIDYRFPQPWTRQTALARTGKFSLGLVNSSTIPLGVAEVRQSSAVTAGKPYTMYLYTSTDADPAGLEMSMRFLDASGTVLTTARTTGDRWGIKATSLRKMALTATAPARAISAIIGMRLAGAVDASGPVRTSAVVDDVRLYDSTPLTNTFSASPVSVVRGHSLTLDGHVAAPGKVRVYVIRPGSKQSVAIADMALNSGAWSRTSRLTMRGTYVFTTKYLGYGPYPAITSAPTSVRVK